MRTKLISGAVLAVVALAAWRIMSPSADLPLVEAPKPAPLPERRPPARQASNALDPGPPVQAPTVSTQINSAKLQSAAPDPNTLNERILVGTKWEREGFALEFGADGRLLIGGRERAQWRVEGSRIRLYRETTGEEHWLDIVGHKLMWEGQEIGRVP